MDKLKIRAAILAQKASLVINAASLIQEYAQLVQDLQKELDSRAVGGKLQKETSIQPEKDNHHPAGGGGLELKGQPAEEF
jgi:hypothetical protein